MPDRRNDINLDEWPRKNHFNFYKDFDQPCFNICLTIDITSAYLFAKRREISILHTLLYLSSQACNQVEAFKLRISKSGQPYQVDLVHPSATVMNSDELFTFCNFSYQASFEKFIKHAKTAQEKVLNQKPLSQIDNRSDLVFYSIIPWLSFSSFSHAQSKDCLDIPKIVFGKFDKTGEKITMPISVELNHALADGIDVARYVNKFDQVIKACANK